MCALAMNVSVYVYHLVLFLSKLNMESTTNPELVTVMPNGENIPGGGLVTHEVADKFFALKGDNVQRAADDVKAKQAVTEVDGTFIGSWLLTEISSWNRDKERLVLLCTNNIISCKYDFVTMKLISVQRIELSKIKEVQSGSFEYPPNSITVPRLYKGLRITWGTMMNKPWYEKWNPFNSEIPFSTFTSHPVVALQDLDGKEVYDVQSFLSSLKRAMEKRPGVLYLEDKPIIIETYAGFVSHVHNQSRLGFSRERGGISF